MGCVKAPGKVRTCLVSYIDRLSKAITDISVEGIEAFVDGDGSSRTSTLQCYSAAGTIQGCVLTFALHDDAIAA